MSNIGVGTGKLTVICGPMFSDKSAELLKFAFERRRDSKRIKLFKSGIDTRDGSVIRSRKGLEEDATLCKSADELYEYLYTCPCVHDSIFIDEAQFFDSSIVSVVEKILQQGSDVFVSGLDLDFAGRPFGPMPDLLAIADEIRKCTAVCDSCLAPATRTYRKSPEMETISIGSDNYGAACPTCFNLYFNKVG